MFTFEYYNGQSSIFTATGNSVRDVLLWYQEGMLDEKHIKYVYRYSKTLQLSVSNNRYKFVPGEMYQLQLVFANGVPTVQNYFDSNQRMAYFYKNKVYQAVEKTTWSKFFGNSSMPYYYDSDEEESDLDCVEPEYEPEYESEYESEYVETDYAYGTEISDWTDESEYDIEQTEQEPETEYSDTEYSD